MNIIFYIAFFIIYTLLGLAPYYVAYLIIEPQSFLGVIGVFFLGSVIVPITLFFAGLILASISGLLGLSNKKNNIDTNNSYELKTIYEDIPKRNNRRKIFIIGGVFFVVFLIILFSFIENNETFYKEKETLVSQEEINDNNYQPTNTPNDSQIEYLTTDQNIPNYIQDDYKLMNMAVYILLDKVDKNGISGAAKDIRNCYVDPDINKLYCVYLDNAARLLDAAISTAYQIPRNEYLYDVRVAERSDKYLYKPNNISDSNFHTSKLEGELRTILHDAMKSKVSSSEIKDIENPVPVEDRKFNEINENNKMIKNIPVDMNSDSESVDDSNDEKVKILMNEHPDFFTE